MTLSNRTISRMEHPASCPELFSERLSNTTVGIKEKP